MKLTSVQLARSLWFIDISETNPRGKNVFADLVPTLIEQYEFKTFPKEGDDFKDGMKFTSGNFVNSANDEIAVGMTIYSDGVAADTYSSTNDSEEFLEQATKLHSDLGYVYSPDMIRRKGYLSQVFVKCSKQLTLLNPKLDALARKIAQASEDVPFGCSAIEFWPEQTRTLKPANFSFQKRSGDAFTEDRYWSQAGLPTSLHLQLLEELEAIL